MGLLLHEKTPRPATLVYWDHRVRAVLRVQADWFFPGLAAAGYGVAGILLSASEGISAAGFIGIALLVGAPAGLGTRALWRWASARLLPWLDAHAIPQTSVARGYRLPARPKFDAPTVILGEKHPSREYQTSGGYDLLHSTGADYSATAEWSVLPAKSLVTGLLVLGAVGSGKTSYVLRPAIFKLFHHASRPGGLVMDSKASLVEPLLAEMRLAGRESDVLPIGPTRPTRWNPLHMPMSSPATVAESMLTTLENLNGAPYASDSRWIRSGAAHLAEGAIGLLRLHAGYVTAKALRYFLCALQSETAGTDEPGKVVTKWLDTLFSGRHAPSKQPDEYEHYSSLVVSRMGEDEKFRCIYVAELLNLLIPLTSPDVAEKYNAPLADLDMPSWSDAINRGLVVSLDCNSRAVPGLAVVLGMMLKLGYQDAMLARLAWARAGLCNSDRYLALIVDEYQDFASPGDADYLALCRESRSMTVIMTQGYASVVQRVGEDRAKVILQSLRNRLVLTQTVPEFAADLLGQYEVEEVDRSISENMQNASLHSTGRFAGESTVSESLSVRRTRKHSIPPEDLASLPTGQGILQSHDGDRSVPLHRVFLLPYFAAPGARHADLGVGM